MYVLWLRIYGGNSRILCLGFTVLVFEERFRQQLQESSMHRD